jgi:hypothetical protein
MGRRVFMFPEDMENHTPSPTATELYATIRDEMCARLEAEGARNTVARLVDLLFLQLLTLIIAWCTNRDEQRLLGQACQDDVVAEPELAGGFAATGGSNAGAPGGRARAVARVIAVAAEPIAADQACLGGEGDARAVCGRRHPVADLATTARAVSALDCGCRVFWGLFAKTELGIGWNFVYFVTNTKGSRIAATSGGEFCTAGYPPPRP